MSRPRLLADNDCNQQIVDGLLRREPLVDFVRLRDVGLHELTDPQVLAWASENEFIIVSHDVNTMRGYAYERVASGQPMAGLMLVHQRDPVGPVIDSLLLIWAESEMDEWRDAVVFLPL